MESRNREPEREQESDPEDAIKAYIKSGVHKNDPKKMAEMIRRMKANSKGSKDMRDDVTEDNTAAKSIFQKYGGGGKKKKGGWRPASKVTNGRVRVV